jgi:nitrogen regulatory protein PII
MKAIFIPYNPAFKERLIDMLERSNVRGFTLWEGVQGRGSHRGEPHYGSHAWPTLNSSILTIVPDDKVESLLRQLHTLDEENESQGLHAFVWRVEDYI